MSQREATCVVCGCTDSRACPGGCSRAVLSRRDQLGLCSACAGTPSAATRTSENERASARLLKRGAR